MLQLEIADADNPPLLPFHWSFYYFWWRYHSYHVRTDIVLCLSVFFLILCGFWFSWKILFPNANSMTKTAFVIHVSSPVLLNWMSVKMFRCSIVTEYYPAKSVFTFQNDVSRIFLITAVSVASNFYCYIFIVLNENRFSHEGWIEHNMLRNLILSSNRTKILFLLLLLFSFFRLMI